MRSDYYQLLEVRKGATAAEIKAAYRNQAKRFHPDLNVGNPAAEERFKLVAEAYRTLGEPERRADYDAWLERQVRLQSAPELAGMAARNGRVRVSVRHAYERRERRGHRRHSVFGRSSGRVPHLFLLRRKGDSGILHFVVFYALCLAVMVPWFISYAGREYPEPVRRDRSVVDRRPGESDLPSDVQERELLNFLQRIASAAEQGDPGAQFRYGMMLYYGYQGIPQDREAAKMWWSRAAESGHGAAAGMLEAARAAEEVPIYPEPDLPEQPIELVSPH